MLDPTFQTLLVEHVSALQLPHLFSGLQRRQADYAIGGGAVGVSVGEEAIQVELVGEDDEIGESRGNGCRGIVDGEMRTGGADAEEERADVFEQSGEESNEHQRDGIGGDIGELTL